MSNGQTFYAGSQKEMELDNVISYKRQQKETFLRVRYDMVETCVRYALGLATRSEFDYDKKLYKEFKDEQKQLSVKKKVLRKELGYSPIRAITEDTKNAIEDFFSF